MNYLERRLYNEIKRFPYQNYKLASIESDNTGAWIKWNFTTFYYNPNPQPPSNGFYYSNPPEEDNRVVHMELPEHCYSINLKTVMTELGEKECPIHDIVAIVEKGMGAYLT